jgi:hemerythrin-like domain-containing protein
MTTIMATKKWSRKVTRTSNALDLQKDVFTKDDPKAIARSLKRSAERSKRRKSSPFRSAMSMLTFYVNRAGKHLSKRRLRILERAKDALRVEFGRPTAAKRA